MANICVNNIKAFTTSVEWKEINEAVDKELLDMGGYTDLETYDYNREIIIETKWSPSPLHDGTIELLSKYFPTTVFRYEYDVESNDGENPVIWVHNGKQRKTMPAQDAIEDVATKQLSRYKNRTPNKAMGVRHTMEIMPNKKLAFKGDNFFGECDVLLWEGVVQVACGALHTVALLEDGSVLACGSNVNGQCDIDLQGKKAISISCGLYHTEIKLADDTSIICGTVDDSTDRELPMIKKAPKPPAPQTITPFEFMTFPHSVDVSLIGSYESSSYIEELMVGEKVFIRKGFLSLIEVLDSKDRTLGVINGDIVRNKVDDIRLLEAFVELMTPLAKRRGNAKYPKLVITLLKKS